MEPLPFWLRLLCADWHGRAAAVWAGLAYGGAKAVVALALLGAAALVLLKTGEEPDGWLAERPAGASRLRSIALAAALGYCVLLLFLKLAQYASLQGTMDAALNLSGVWNVHSKTWFPLPVIGLEHHFGAHFRPIVLLYAPVAWLTRSPLAVIELQALLVYSSLVPLWLLGGAVELPAAPRVLLCLCLGTSFYFHDTLMTWFYPETLALPAFLWALWAWERRRLGWFVLFAALLIACKEEGPLSLGCLGLAAFLTRERRREGFALMAASAAALVLVLWAMHPSREYYGARNWQSTFGAGDNATQTAHALLHAPAAFLGQWLWPPKRFLPLIELFLSTAGLALFYPPGAAALVVHAAPHQMVRADNLAYGFHTLVSYYGDFMLPLLFWSSAKGLAVCWRRFPRQRGALAAVLLLCSAVGLWQSSEYVLFGPVSEKRLSAAWSLIREVRPGERVWAQQAFCPALSFRPDLKAIESFGTPAFDRLGFEPETVLLDADYLAALPEQTRRRLLGGLKARYAISAERAGVVRLSPRESFAQGEGVDPMVGQQGQRHRKAVE